MGVLGLRLSSDFNRNCTSQYKRQRKPFSCKLRFETLEDRCLLSTTAVEVWGSCTIPDVTPPIGCDGPKIAIETGVHVETGAGNDGNDGYLVSGNLTARSTPYQFKQIEDDKTLTITGTGTVTIYTQFVFRPALITLAAGSELIVHAGQALQLQLPAAPGDPGAFITPHQLHFVIDTTNAPAGEPAATIDFKTIQRGDIAAQSPDGLKILDASGSKGKSKGGMGGDVIVMANGAGISGTIHALGGDAVGYSSNSGGDGGNGGTIAVAVTTITNTLHLDTSGGKGSYGMGMYSVTTPGGTGGNGGAISMEIVNSVNSSLINAKADGGWGGVGGCGTFGTDIQGLYWPDENHDPDDSLVPHAGDGGNGGKGGRGGGIGRIDIKADGKSISFPTKPGNGGSGGRGGFGGRVLPPDNNYVGYPGNGGQGGMGGDAGGPGALPGFGGLGGDAGALWWDNVPWIVGLEGSDGLPGTYPANPLPPPHYVSPPVMPEQDDWTIMVYVAGDSQRNCQPDIQQALAIALDRLEDVDLGNVPINVVMQMDRYDASLPGDFTWPTPFCNPESRRGWITYDGVKDSIRSVFLPVTIGNNPNSSADRNNSSASYTLQNFIQWAVGEAPAEHYALILQGHGAGIVGLLEDNTSNDIMGLRRVGAAIEGAGLSRPIDVVAVQCCNEQIVELATELRGKALYVVGSQWPLDYCEIDGNFTSGNRWLGWLRNHPHASASDLTGKMVSVYGTLWNMITFLWELKAQTYSTLDMTKMPMLISAVKAFVDTADTCIGKDSSIISDLERIRNITREDNPQQQVDLGVFMYKVATDPILKAKQPIDQPGSLCYSAWATYNQAKKLVIQRGGWLTWSHTGISVFFPKKNHDQARILYPPFDGAGGYNATNFQFVAETRWDDFLRHLIPSPPPPSASSTPTVCSKATANPFPDLEGTVVDPTATVQVTVAGHTYDAINKDDGTWALPGTALVAPLAEGTYEVVAIAYDINGNMVGEPGKGELIIDFHQPASDMYPLPDISPTKDFVLSWSGADNENGSGIAHLEIYVSDNNGPLSLWLINAAETPVVFYGQSGHHYAFYSVAVDLAGNAETLPAVPDAVTTVEIGSTAIWSGIGADDHWTTAANWIGDIAPSPGDVLLFSANSAQLKSVNNYPAGTVFGEIIVCGSGYQIEGEVASSDNVHVRDGADLTASSVTANTLTIGGVETCTWNGGGGDNLWTTAENWTDDVAPLPGDNLVFPGDAARLENVNDFPAGTVFGDIVVEGGDYSFQNGSVNAENVSVQNNARLTVASIIAGTISIGNVDETTFWSTFLGGDEDDMAYEIVVDDAGNSFLVGATYSPDFPASDGFDPSYNDDSDAFVAKFAPTGELLWSTYLGGSSYEHAWSATLDAEGNILVTGMTASGDFPVTSGSFDTSLDGETDAFIAKFSSSGELLWATYLGGSMWDQCNDIAVDNAGNIFVIGDTYSDDLPALGGFDTSFDGNEEDISDGFVAKLNSSGMAVWVSYLGGSDCDWGNVITVDHEDNILLSGLTFSGDFPAYQGFDMTYHDGGDVFLVKLTNSGDLLWATFLGGSARDQAEGLTVDADGQVFVGGITYSEDFPTLGGFDASLDGACDAFLAKITTSGQLLWASYIGGSDQDWINDIAIDETGDLFVTGRTYSGDFPLSGGFDSTLDGECDAFVAKINSSAGLTWSSYFGGSNFESGSGIALDHLGNVFLTGRTTSGDLPTTSDCFDSSYNGENDVYLAKIHIKETGDVRTWDGGGEDNQWSTAENWAKGETPLPGDGLVFPAEADTFVCVNDFPAGTVFGEIVVEGGDYSFQNNGLNAESVQVQGDASLTVASIAAGTLTIGEGEESGVEGRRSGVESRGSKVESRGSGVESRVASGESSIRPTTGNQRLTVLPDPQVLPITSAQRANDLLNDWPVGPIDDYVLPYSPGRCPGLGETGPFGATGVTSVSIAAPVIRVFRLEERGQVDNLSHVGQVDNLSHAAPVLPAFYAMYASAEDALHRTSRFPTFDDSRSRAAYETPRFNWSWLDDLSESRRKKRDALREQLVFSAVDELFGNL